MVANHSITSRYRLITVAVGWTLIFGIIAFAPPIVFDVVVCLIALLAFNEFLRICKIDEEFSLYLIALLAFLSICITILFFPFQDLVAIAIISPLLVIATALISLKDAKSGIEKLAKVVFGAIYASFLLFLIIMRRMSSGRELVIVVSVGTWGRDLATYVFGRLIRDGHVILPTISPRKTYEVATCGLLFTLVIVALSIQWLLHEWTWLEILIIGILIGSLGQIGDLAESWLKRSTSVTDSSQILPGQGGILDSFDSFIFTAPVMYLYLTLALTK